MEFVETESFSELRAEYFGGDDSYRLFQNVLLLDPEWGDVIPGCGGLRKVRWPDARRGKGKRGGLRVIYLYVPDVKTIVLLDVYDKDQSSDLSTEDKREFAALAREVRDNLREGGPVRRREP